MTISKHCILYVDDESENLNAFRMVFGTKYNVLLCSNGSDAMKMLKENEVQVVLSDQRMPDMSGLELCARINAFNADISCIIITAYSDIEVTMQAINQGGIYAFILKPWNENEVSNKIENALEKYYLKTINSQLIEQLKDKTIELDKAWKKANESDNLKTAFIANLSHEIKSPLNSIVGFTELLIKHSKNFSVKESGFIEIISAAGKQLQNIINDILDISRLESGITIVKSEPVNIQLMLNEIYLVQKPNADKKDIVLTIESGMLPNKDLMVDKTKLMQIVNNLINNAIKFTSAGQIQFGCVYSDTKKQELKFYVSDTGSGIDKTHYKTIFERFRQVNAGNYKFKQGNGLGLSIVKSYVELMGGKIWVESEINKGSTFNFTLPANWSDEFEKDTSVHMMGQISIKEFNVLIVEDELANYLFLKEIISESCKNIFHAQTGADAINIATNQHIDLILMDIKMPVMNGFDASREIKKVKPHIPIIAQTAYGLPTDYETLEQSGFDGIITKPFTISQLLKTISGVLLKQVGSN